MASTERTRPPAEGLGGFARKALGVAGRSARSVAEALATPLLPEDFLGLIDPLRLGADLRGRVVAVDHEFRGATTLTIKPGRGWRRPTPGQYIRIGFEVDGVRLWRAYSLTGPVDGKTLTISVRAIADGKVSNHVLSKVRPGQLVHLDQAAGDFVLPEPAPSAVLFLTAGSGITPVMGMLRNHLQLSDVVVVHSAPSEEEMMFRDELRALHAGGRIRFVERITGRDGSEVRLPVARIGDVVPDWAERHTWACGPTGLLDEAEEYWDAHGIASQLHTERFRPRITAVGEGGEISFSTSGVTVAADAATTILDAGEDAGVLMPSGCRMGICFNCVAQLREGSVRDLRTGELTAAIPEDPVLVQTCVSAAAGPCQIVL